MPVSMRTFLMLGLAASVTATTELNPDNWDMTLASGKSLFVKFFAPWCGHCKKMKPDWDKLAEELAENPKVMIADVDCTAGGKPLCDTKGVKGFPTIKYFNPPDEEGEDYKGGRDYASLLKFATTELGPGCSVDALENCSEEQKRELETYTAMPAEERETMMATLKAELAEAEAKNEALLKELQASYKASMDGLEKLKDESAPKIKLLKAATPTPPKAEEEIKDEV
uniref:Thioredoxin domain-containing protein n=1 Tax=Coccolithus braarudii TaxID=221442 RepID=A0A7S0Q3T2_9EUKA|mmetsp:Transcript_39048/g.83230  ORF Transcript_39048/g.83230 Transcript_39048/m.83230 type:complete len:226 (+) Transcript_39048:65-742(+)